MAQPLPPLVQRLGVSQPKDIGVLAPRLNPPHAQKTLQSGLKSPDGLLGEITVDRGGFAIRDRNQVVVGAISPELTVEGWDANCDNQHQVVIKPVQPGVYVIINGNTP